LTKTSKTLNFYYLKITQEQMPQGKWNSMPQFAKKQIIFCLTKIKQEVSAFYCSLT
jgi:hypothetical protein